MANFIRLVHFRFIAILLNLILNKNNFILSQDFSDHPHKGGFSGYSKDSAGWTDNRGNEYHNGNNGQDVYYGPLSSCTDPQGNPGECRLPVQCAVYFTHFIMTNNVEKFRCKLFNGNLGICCPEVRTPTNPIHSVLQPDQFPDGHINPKVGSKIRKELSQTAESAQSEEQNQVIQDDEFVRKNIVCQRGTASYGHLLFSMTTPSAQNRSRLARNLLLCSNRIKQQFNLNPQESGLGLHEFSMKNTIYSAECPKIPQCQQSRYRTPDGSCNNLQHPEMGAALSRLVRLLPPEYEDGLWSPRVSQSGRKLPSARQLSSSIIKDENHPHPFFTLWLMQFGQFVDHDQTHVPVFRLSNGRGIECCVDRGKGFRSEDTTHPMCFPIEILRNDPFHSRYGSVCMNVVRSMIAPRQDCSLGHADQLNQNTHWLDSSNIYGSSAEGERNLRMNRESDGLLNFDLLNRNSRPRQYPNEMLPRSRSEDDECSNPRENRFCFLAGDLRTNEMIGLTATHTLWMREHNRVARALKRINPTFTGDQIFHEAKRIVNAEYQHIIYNEWLPIIVGKQYMDIYGITPITNGYYTEYDPNINAGIANEFAAAAMRMGHTLIQGILALVRAENYEPSGETIEIHNHFNEPFDILEDNRLDRILKSLAQMTVQSYDSFITSEVTNRLFQPRNESYGMDLIALNIQRARDHGIPGYNSYREICNVGRVSSFDELKTEIPSHIVELLKKYYAHVDDIDLYIGGITESSFPGSLLGPTFKCIIADQFVRLRKGDRFAYDIGGWEHSFTPEQLQEIRKASFARILCDNGNTIDSIQPLAFYRPHNTINPLTSCQDPLIPKLNLDLWRGVGEVESFSRKG